MLTLHIHSVNQGIVVAGKSLNVGADGCGCKVRMMRELCPLSLPFIPYPLFLIRNP